MLAANNAIHNFFSKVLLLQYINKNKKYSETETVKKLKLPHAFFLKQYSAAAINYLLNNNRTEEFINTSLRDNVNRRVNSNFITNYFLIYLI